jgi:uncharacterized UPF0160 family protein
MTTRTFIVKSLQRLRVNKLAHKLYHRYVHGFDAADNFRDAVCESSSGSDGGGERAND